MKPYIYIICMPNNILNFSLTPTIQKQIYIFMSFYVFFFSTCFKFLKIRKKVYTFRDNMNVSYGQSFTLYIYTVGIHDGIYSLPLLRVSIAVRVQVYIVLLCNAKACPRSELCRRRRRKEARAADLFSAAGRVPRPEEFFFFFFTTLTSAVVIAAAAAAQEKVLRANIA